MNPRNPIIVMMGVGLAIIVALSFVPYSLSLLPHTGQHLAVIMTPGVAPATAMREAAHHPEPVAPVSPPSFDAALWYASRGEEPEKHGVLIASMDGRRVFASHNADTAFNPASLVKLATTLVVLRKLGASHRFETRVYTEGTVDSSGTLRGRIYLAGNDPTFGDAAAALIARELRARGITRATEGIYVAPNFSFNFNESPQDSARNAAQVMKLGDAKSSASKKGAEKKGAEKKDTATQQDKKRAGETKNAREADRRKDNRAARERNDAQQRDDNRDEVSGEAKEESNVDRTRTGDASNLSVSEPPPVAPLFVLHTHTLRDVLLYMNAHSSNFVAERVGALVGGAEGVRRFLIDELKLPAERVALSTTSGLEHNRLTPAGLFAVIRALNEEAQRQGLKLEDIMPVVSSDWGTLRHRLKETPIAGAAVGKTGTLAHDDGGMASLAGVVYTQNAGMVVFAILDQGHTIWESRQLEEQLLAEVVTTQDVPIPIPMETPRKLLPQTNYSIANQ